jgi:hypothetical protein
MKFILQNQVQSNFGMMIYIFHSGTPASSLANATPHAEQLIHTSIERESVIPIAGAREQPSRACVCSRNTSVFLVRETAKATLNGRIIVMKR